MARKIEENLCGCFGSCPFEKPAIVAVRRSVVELFPNCYDSENKHMEFPTIESIQAPVIAPANATGIDRGVGEVVFMLFHKAPHL